MIPAFTPLQQDLNHGNTCSRAVSDLEGRGKQACGAFTGRIALMAAQRVVAASFRPAGCKVLIGFAKRVRYDTSLHDLRSTVVAKPYRILLTAVATVLLSACASLAPAPDAGTLRLRAEAAYERDDYADAVRYYRQLTAVTGGDAVDWYRLGNALAHMERLEEAADAYETALAHDPTYYKARHNLSLVHFRLGVEHFVEARRALPDADRAALTSLRYLGCIAQALRGTADPSRCAD